MALRPCAEHGCPALVSTGRCDEHRREKERARGSRQQRGYDANHDRLRAQWAPAVEAGDIDCARCHLPIVPGTPWHLDHRDDRAGYLGPSHLRCNTSAGGRASHRR